MKKISERQVRFSIFQKLLVSFTIIIVLPLIITFIFFERTTNQTIFNKLYEDTANSLELVANSVDELRTRMVSVGFILSQDENLKNMLNSEYISQYNIQSDQSKNNLDKLERLDSIKKMLESSQSYLRSRCYITILYRPSVMYLNWKYMGESCEKYIANQFEEMSLGMNNGLKWRGIEENYVESDRNLFPYVLTLTIPIISNINDERIGEIIISVPESVFHDLISNNNAMQKRVMLDENLKILSSSDSDYLGMAFEDIYKKTIPIDKKGYFTTGNKNMEKKFLTYYRIDNLGWIIVDEKMYGLILQEISTARNNLIILNLLCFVTFLSVSSIIAGSIAKPLKFLSNQMIRLDINHSQIRKEYSSKRKDEIGILEESFYEMQGNIRDLICDNLIKEKRKRIAEIQMLQAQVSPHFLFNTLNSIRFATLNNHVNKAADMIFALINLLRMTLTKNEEFITIGQEMDTINNYIKIMQLRHDIDFCIYNNIDQAILQYKIPRFLFQPLVENSIIHGFGNLKAMGIIEINSFIHNHELTIQIKDNGGGMDHSGQKHDDFKSRKFSGIGLSNIDERIKLNYGQEYGLTIESKLNEGTVVELHLPYKFGQ